MFFFLERDSFEARSRESAAEIGAQQKIGVFKDKAPIRRPYRGIQIKSDTYAVLSVRTPDGRAIPLSSSSMIGGNSSDSGGKGQVSEYSDFILQQVNDQRMEKQQIIETFGDTYVYFFGERPRIITLSGQLISTEDFNWRAQFWYNYEKYLRGSRLVQLNARCYLAYDTIVIEGYPLQATAVDDAENPYQVSFQMTMLMTDYHEFSQIGSTKFPAARSSGFDVLNQELSETRSRFVSTTYQVRAFNVRGSTSNQIPKTNSALAALRAGVSAWNSAATWLGDQLHTVSSLLGGRSMRVPIGAASYLEMLTEGEVAVGSGHVTTTATNGVMDPANKVFIPGRTLLIMGPSKFAPSWTSKAIPDQPRGMIYENVDEYPLRENPNASLQSLLGESQYNAYMSRVRIRHEKMSAFKESLIQYNVFAAQGSVLGAIAEVVGAVRSGFGMLMTAANAIRDPMGAVTSALGVTPMDIKRFGEGLADGAFIPGVSFFVGGAARKTWAAMWDDAKTRYTSGNIGDVFSGFEYKSNAARLDTAGALAAGLTQAPNSYESALGKSPEDTAYDMTYGSNDYSSLIGAQATEDAATVSAQGDLPPGVDRTEPNAGKTASTLDEVYGDTDSASYGSQSEPPATIEEVYGSSGTIKKTRPSAEERAKMIEEAYNGDAPPNDTDTSGITASDADGAPIDPVV